MVMAKLRTAIVGSPATVAAGIDGLLRDTWADEIIAVTDTWDEQDRLNSFTHLAALAPTLSPVAPTPA
jgi:alkanesulfonate monooxygenase SsuD/methylene tetrahydromethanopterin reductase-like flavin-dependent oxidoreductase (luciferase family)